MGFAKGEPQSKDLMASQGQLTMKSTQDVHRAADMFACTAMGDSQAASTKLLIQDLPQVPPCLMLWPAAYCLKQSVILVLGSPAGACMLRPGCSRVAVQQQAGDLLSAGRTLLAAPALLGRAAVWSLSLSPSPSRSLLKFRSLTPSLSCKRRQQTEPSKEPAAAESKQVGQYAASWPRQFAVLAKRHLLGQLRNPTDSSSRLLMSCYVGILAGTPALQARLCSTRCSFPLTPPHIC